MSSLRSLLPPLSTALLFLEGAVYITSRSLLSVYIGVALGGAVGTVGGLEPWQAPVLVGGVAGAPETSAQGLIHAPEAPGS